MTNKFKKELKLMEKQGKNIDKLDYVVEKLANSEKLSSKYKDHSLTGEYKGARECHIEPDWLLIYEYQDDDLILELLRTGSHTNLFRKM